MKRLADGQIEPARTGIEVECVDPFDLDLSLRAMRSFGTSGAAAAASPVAGSAEAALRLGVRFARRPALLEIGQVRLFPALVRAETRPLPVPPGSLRSLTERVVNAGLDLKPFYELASGHPVLGPLSRSLYGLKAFQPASLFDMLVTAVIEQQISLAAARQIRARLLQRFGDEVEGEPVFPDPERLAATSLDDLKACGLSTRKAEYVTGLAAKIVEGSLDLERLERAPSDEAREAITSLRGFGPWSAEYVLIRGLARPDSVPTDDLGVRSVVGEFLGDGGRSTPAQTAALLEPFAPYRGLAAFYLLAAARLF